MKTNLGVRFTLEAACLCGVIALALTGCCGNKFWKVQKASSIQDAGAVHIAVLTVAPFAKYRESVQPQFKLSPDDALNQVLPSTLALEERIVDLLGLKLKVGLPTTTSTETTTMKEQSGSQPLMSRESTTTSKTGDVSGLTAETPTAGGRTAAGQPGGGSTLGTTLGQNPLLKFWTAAALYQEVQLLNRYIQDAAVSEGFMPFVVRLQVSLLPWARGEPYDAYADISFFRGDFLSHSTPATGPSGQQAGGVEASKNPPPSDGRTSQNEVRILPLLVTDDIEAAIEARSFDRVRQLALALSAVIKGVGLESNIESVQEQLQSVTGRDYNSAFTVARASHNTLRVRFGALNQGSARYAMIPQTHNVTLLLMVPKDMLEKKEVHERTVRIVSRTALVDAQNGKELEDKYSKYGPDEILKVLAERGIDKHNLPHLGELYRLQRYVARNDCAGFRKYVENELQKYVNKNLPDPKIKFLDSLWVDLASLREQSRYQTAILTLPKYEQLLGLDRQIPLLIDDGKSSISTKLVGIRDFNPKELLVGLKAKTRSLGGDGNVLPGTEKEVYLAANSIKQGLSDDEFLVTFPSLRAVKRRPIDDNAEVVVSTRDVSCSVLNGKIYSGVYAVTQGPPLFELSVRSPVINSDEKGQGKLVINVKKAPPDGVTLNLSGADVETASTVPAGIVSADPKDPSALKVSKPGVVTLLLFNLNPESNITVSGTDESGTSSTPITVRVVSLPSSKQKRQE